MVFEWSRQDLEPFEHNLFLIFDNLGLANRGNAACGGSPTLDVYLSKIVFKWYLNGTRSCQDHLNTI